jgi:hypothetical protein
MYDRNKVSISKKHFYHGSRIAKMRIQIKTSRNLILRGVLHIEGDGRSKCEASVILAEEVTE